MMKQDVLLDIYSKLFVSRASDYARQQEDGHYLRVGQPLTREVLTRHLHGRETIGSYVMNERGRCRFACFDADASDGLQALQGVQSTLADEGIRAYLEASRRGGHLWVFLAHSIPASRLRAWLLPFCPGGIEFYPKQDGGCGYGSLMRLPLGVHQRTGLRYPFVVQVGGQFQPTAPSLLAMLRWLATAERVVPPLSDPLPSPRASAPRPALFDGHHVPPSPRAMPLITPASSPYASIRDWCAAQDPYALIGRYVQLDRHGMGCCPFGEHHSDGADSRPSLRVYSPKGPGEWCWYCYTWGRGGNQFNFLAMYYGLDGHTLWQRLREGGKW